MVLPGGEKILLTLSGAAYGIPAAGETAQEVFARADRALYRAIHRAAERMASRKPRGLYPEG